LNGVFGVGAISEDEVGGAHGLGIALFEPLRQVVHAGRSFHAIPIGFPSTDVPIPIETL
jgi:hypothetical protein